MLSVSKAAKGNPSNKLLDVMQSLVPLLMGTMPEVNWNEIDGTEVSSTSFTFLFSYNGNKQFLVTVTNPMSNFSVAVTTYQNLITEDGLSAIGLEDGSELLLEG